jgi:hypothetical protein
VNSLPEPHATSMAESIRSNSLPTAPSIASHGGPAPPPLSAALVCRTQELWREDAEGGLVGSNSLFGSLSVATGTRATVIG